jgi:predicted transcriptional regulator
MFKTDTDILVEKDGVLQGIVTWSELMKIYPDQRDELRIAQMLSQKFCVPKTIQTRSNILIIKEKIDVLPVVKKDNPHTN